MRDIVKAPRRPRRFAQATGTAASQGFRQGARGVAVRGTASRGRRGPKALGSRLYESIIRTSDITPSRKMSEICRARITQGVVITQPRPYPDSP